MQLVVVKIYEVVQLVRRSVVSSYKYMHLVVQLGTEILVIRCYTSYENMQLVVVKISEAVQLGIEILVRRSQSYSQIIELRVRAVSGGEDF